MKESRMPRAYRLISTPQRRLLALLVVVMVLFSACAGAETAEEETDTSSGGDATLKKWERSLRKEADWLWSNMNYVSTHNWPEDDADCEDQTFNHNPVEMTEDERDENPVEARTLDQLEYAGLLLEQSHEMWLEFCAEDETGQVTYAFMESRMRPAYESLNQAKTTITALEEAEED
jgi:hypothetical protein